VLQLLTSQAIAQKSDWLGVRVPWG